MTTAPRVAGRCGSQGKSAMTISAARGGILLLAAHLTASTAALGQPVPPEEESFSLETALGDQTPFDQGGRSFWDGLGENLRINVDVVTRVKTTRRRGEAEGLVAVGLDIHKVFSDAQGDIGTLLLQPYLLRRDNVNPRPIEFPDGDDSFALELHDFYFNLTRWGRGRTNIKIGHFDVPFGLEPLYDTHFTIHQFIPMHDAGFKKDWGVSLNGAFPEFDYEVSVTTGTGMDLTGLDRDPYLVAGRIGTPSDRNRVLGLSALYGEVIDEHGIHRIDENDPLGDVRELDGFVRRLRVGFDFTQIVNEFTFKGEVSGGRDFEQEVFNTLLEVSWTSPDDTLTAYLQGVYLGQDDHLGWDENVRTHLGALWKIDHQWKLSTEWVHDLRSWAENKGGVHINDDEFKFQLRVTF